MTKMLAKEPAGRQSAAELLVHQFIEMGRSVESFEMIEVIEKTKEAKMLQEV